MKYNAILRSIFICIWAIQSIAGKAQTAVPCITDELHQAWVLQDSSAAAEEKRANDFYIHELQHGSKNKATSVKYIPVVFHLVHGWGNENISQAQVNDQLRILNEDFRKMTGTNGGSSTDPLAVDMEYEFRLAQYDPNGNPTDGVTRDYSTLSANARDNVKAVNYWPSDRFYNIWVVNSIKNNTGDPQSIVLGYAQFPSDRTSRPTTDGVVLRHDQVGIIGTGQASQAGRTLTHESGHWVGLYHTFQDGCGSKGDDCSVQGDYVCDTPPVASASSGCQNGRNSCSTDSPDLPDMIKNYMDYSDGTCMNIYTAGQKARSLSQVTLYRSNIYSSSNLSAAGINTDGTYKTLNASSKKAPFNFDFNVSTLTGTGWEIEPYNIYPDTAWQINQSIGLNDGKSMYIRNFLINRLNTVSAFFSPSYDVSAMSNPKLYFNIAYAKRLSASNCKLRIYVSNNYGRTETLAYTFGVTDMATVDVMATEFVPTASQWKQLSVDLSAYKTYTNLRLRFEFTSIKGNNVFVDNVRVEEPTGISEQLKEENQFNFYPNPATQEATLHLNAMQNGTYAIDIIDLQGKQLFSETHVWNSGSHDLPIHLDAMNKGFYILRVNTPNGIITEKFCKE